MFVRQTAGEGANRHVTFVTHSRTHGYPWLFNCSERYPQSADTTTVANSGRKSTQDFRVQARALADE